MHNKMACQLSAECLNENFEYSCDEVDLRSCLLVNPIIIP